MDENTEEWFNATSKDLTIILNSFHSLWLAFPHFVQLNLFFKDNYHFSLVEKEFNQIFANGEFEKQCQPQLLKKYLWLTWKQRFIQAIKICQYGLYAVEEVLLTVTYGAITNDETLNVEEIIKKTIKVVIKPYLDMFNLFSFECLNSETKTTISKKIVFVIQELFTQPTIKFFDNLNSD